MSVTKRFSGFLNNITLTEVQLTNGRERREKVIEVLNRKYYNSSNKTLNSVFVGSWAKSTRIRPPRDVDVLFTLPKSVYDRFDARYGNRQSQLLQEIRETLLSAFQLTKIRGDGPVVLVPFTSYNVELIPAFSLVGGGHWVPMTDNGGRYKKADYAAESSAIATSNSETNGQTRDLVRMMKRWQGYCNVPIKSFWIELIAIDFLRQWEHKGKSKEYYDWMVRDFLAYLTGRKNSYVYAPGTGEAMNVGSAWESRASTALSRARKACSLESDKNWEEAGVEWQKIFGMDVPKKP